jgi:flagellin
MDLELNLTTAAATTLATHAFTVTGGGATYQIGPEVNSQQNVSIGIQSVAASRLGNEAQGFLSSIITGGASSLVDGNAADASTIVDTSIDQVAVLRGRLGAFERNTLQTTIRSQQIALENLTASESSIRDTDFAAETARLTRAQILVQAGTATLQIANSTAQNVLALLS